MYLQYKTNTTWLVSELMSDITAILTGTTDVAALSASCDKPNTSFLASTKPSAWTVHDPLTGDVNYSKILAAPDATAAVNKYIKIRYVASSGITFNVYSTWNAATHTGTDATSDIYTCGYNTPSIVTTQSLVLYIIATTEYIYILPYQAGTLLNAAFIGEISRNGEFTDYYSAANLKSVAVGGYNQTGTLLGSSVIHFVPRLKNPTSAGETASTTVGSSGLIISYVNSSNSLYTNGLTHGSQNTNNTSPGLTIYPRYYRHANGSMLARDKSAYILANTLLPAIAMLDEVIVSGVTYVVCGFANDGAYVMLPKG